MVKSVCTVHKGSRFVLGLLLVCAGALGAAPTRLVFVPLDGTLDGTAVREAKKGIENALQGGSLRHVILDVTLQQGDTKALEELAQYLYVIRTQGVNTVGFVRSNAHVGTATFLVTACKEIALGPGARLGDLHALGLDGGMREALLAWAAEMGRSQVLYRRMLELGGALLAYRYTPPLREERWLLLTPEGYEAAGEEVRRHILSQEQLCAEGQPLVLSPDVPWQFEIARAQNMLHYRPDTREKLLSDMALFDLREDEIVEVGRPGFSFSGSDVGRKVAEFFQLPLIRFLLILGALLCIFIEFQVPGLGLPGIIALVCLGIFFGTGLYTGYVSIFELGLFLVGLILLALEILVIPGFGVAGIAGVVCLLVSLVLAMVKGDFSEGFDEEQLMSGVLTTLLSIACAVVGMAVCSRFLSRNAFIRRAGLVHAA